LYVCSASLTIHRIGDFEKQDLKLRAMCQRCSHQLVVGGWLLAAARFRCNQVVADGTPCRGIKLPSTGKARRWTQKAAEHARSLKP
jgi:hypothetical protein